MRLRFVILGKVVAAVILGACSGAQESAVTVTSPTISASIPIATGGHDETITMQCADSISPGTPASPTDLQVSGVTFSGIPAKGRAPEGSIRVGSGAQMFRFRKTFLYVAPAAATKTRIQVVAPDDGRLYYTSDDQWMSAAGDAQIVPGSGKTVIVPRCGNASRGFFGGFLTQSTNCVTLSIVSGTGPPTTVRIPIDGGSC